MSTLSFGQRFRIARIQADLTIKEAAERMNRCKWTVINLESGDSVNDRTRAAAIKLFPSLSPFSN